MKSCAYAVVTFGDIGMGLIVPAIIVCPALGVDLTWTYLALGVFSALLPDLDAIPEFWRHGNVSAHAENCRDHREGFHYPIPIVVIGTTFLMATFGVVPATIFSLSVLSHFIHDSFGTGWGVKWLWPFSKRNFKFYTDKENEYGQRNSDRLLVVSWTPEELNRAIKLYGVRDWFPTYIKSPQFLIESWLFLFGLLIIILHAISVSHR